MSHILKFSRSYLLLIASALLLAFVPGTGSCQSDIIDTDIDDMDINMNMDIINLDGLTSEDNNLKDITSIDQLTVASYSNGDMGLLTQMQTACWFEEDGTLEKSRKTSMFSFGSDLLEMMETSSFTGLDELGNEYSYVYEKSTTLKDFSYPFALIQDDILKLSGNDLSLLGFDSNKYILLSGDISTSDLNTLSEAFGGLGSNQIKYFKIDQSMTSASNSLSIDLSMFFTEDLWTEAMKIFHEGAIAQSEKENSEIHIPITGMFETSNGEVSCKWGTMNG